jgi:xanthine phosphoribosyltransferase
MPTPSKSPRPHVALSWGDIRRDALLLAAKLAVQPWRGIVAVTRGGLAPAALTAKALDIRVIETIGVAAYQGEQLTIPKVLKNPTVAGDGTGWLVIDDLVDTGVTMQIVRKILPAAHLAVLYAKPQGRALADTFVREFPQDCWIDFPWEV